MGQFLWLLVEWIGEQRTHAYDVVNSCYVISQKADLHTGKIVFLHYNCSKNQAREAKVLKISDDKHHITRLKLILIKQQEQEDIYRIENFFNITIDKMRSGSVSRSENQLPFERRQSQSTRGDDDNSFVTDTEPRVPIGSGKITVPARVLEVIDWSEPYYTTKELLEAVFPKHVLATHSLTGKPSPRLLIKQTKNQLNPLQVNEIVLTVSEKCGISESLVRKNISNICWHVRKRFHSSQGLPEQEDQKNVQLSTSSSKQICRGLRKESRSENQLPFERRQSQSTRGDDDNFFVIDTEPRVPIRSGIITVPASVYEAINWNDHYNTIKELLEAVFPKQ